LRAEHSDRDQIRAELVSPAGTRVRILSGEGVSGSDYQNYTLLLADAAGGALSQLGRDHDITVPDFLDVVRPDEPLIAFMGEEAAGTWKLNLCDTDAASDGGNYLAGRLYLLPRDTTALSGSWSQSLSLPELDGVEQALTAYGLDQAGNRTNSPWRHTFVVDNVPPSIDVTLAIDAVQLTPDLAALEVLAGSVADGGQVRRLYAMVRTPEGQLHNQPVTRDGDGWSFALQTTIVGVHTIHIVAEDVAGNRTAVGPFTVMVTGIVEQPVWKLYLPVVLNAAGGSEAALAPASSVGVPANASSGQEDGPALLAGASRGLEWLVKRDAILEPRIDQSYGQNKRLKERQEK
jgi:hypothetical protein